MRIVSADEATATMLAVATLQPPLRFPLSAALGHVLAEDVVAAISLPPWTNAGMDGYALRGDDVRGATPDAPIRLRVAHSIPAGGAAGGTLNPGSAARIFTGAPLPPGADSVIRQEDTTREDDVVAVHRDRDVLQNVRAAGGDLSAGSIAMVVGTLLGAHQLALLAALGVSHPMMHRRARVGIISTGDELISLDHPEEIASGRRLADVNSPALSALTVEAGGVPVSMDIAADRADSLSALIAAASDVDLIVTAGGVSVGDHDHVRAVMREHGAVMQFDRVRMRPGGPAALALLPDGRPWLALPGNPVSAMVTFELFARPAIRAMAGMRAPLRATFPAVLAAPLRPDAALEQFLRCTFNPGATDGPVVATLTGPQGSGMLTSMARADGLVRVPAGDTMMAAGTPLHAIRFS